MSGKNPFLLIARIGVKENMVEEYLAIAEEVDDAVQESEPGMLFHNFDKDPDDPLGFVWSEVYTNSQALIAHINNPPVQAYVKKHDELADIFEIEVYGNLSEDAISAVKALEVPFKHFKSTAVGYVREENF
ncbi:MAG: putative quinol monooxygenase [Gammaproteobacteria bacterium]|nr:MAG: antibiotic biosynthesis monooxygenase [Gammaproteobacteria bacterium TMED104]RPG52085.1 MAG: antibiotic biosynthesis monooxygenase [Gammaproteobacteria bacterium TMED104]|tara:strand:+ start:5068 stop:5460 length:393 start_codon:yes stop_codon:yes gene_type:complete